MSFRRYHLVWMLPLFALTVVLLLGVAADSWLESAGGRHMLQTKLSKDLGLPVRLEGDFSLRLFPRLEIAGQELEIGQPGESDALAFSKDYSAVIELAPFLDREVKISSIRLNGGFLDLSHWPPAIETADEKAGSRMSFPQVASLEIENFYIRVQPEEKSLLIQQLRITGFRQGHESSLEMQARLMDRDTEVAQASLQGGLILAVGGLPTRLSVREMKLKLGSYLIDGLGGYWEWDQPAARLTGQMGWGQASSAADLRLTLALESEPSGSFAASYQGPQLPGDASLAFDFSVRPEVIGLERLNMQVIGQSLNGNGCLVLAEKPSLRLFLRAESLDMDKIYSIDFMQAGEGAELPLELAVELRVEKAWFAGAEAGDVVVTVGDEPVCPGQHP